MLGLWMVLWRLRTGGARLSQPSSGLGQGLQAMDTVRLYLDIVVVCRVFIPLRCPLLIQCRPNHDLCHAGRRKGELVPAKEDTHNTPHTRAFSILHTYMQGKPAATKRAKP